MKESTNTFIGKQWVWKGGFPHLVLKAEIMEGGGEIYVSNFRFVPQIFGGAILLSMRKIAPQMAAAHNMRQA